MKKIYFIRANKTKFGGAENYLERFTNSMSNKGYDFEVINSKIPKLFPSWVRALVFNFYVCLTKGKRFYFSLERVTCSDLYRAGDGVHKVFLRRSKKSKLNLLHPVYLYLEKKCFIKSKKIISNSKMIKEEIIREYGIDEKNIEVIYNGIDTKIETNSYIESLQDLSNEFSVDLNKPIFLYVGNGFERKGVAEFLHILKKIDNKNTLAFVVGHDKKIDYYKKLAKTLSIEENVIFTGERNDVNKFFAVSDFFILPTFYDPFANVILEAMFFRNIVFTTRNNGASEILDSKFVMKDPMDFSVISLIKSLIQDSEIREKIKNENHNLSKKYSIDKNLINTLKVINEVVN